MKKVLSILLSAVLLLSAVFVAMPMTATAAATPIKATPLAGTDGWQGSLEPYYDTSSTAYNSITILDWINAKGFDLSAANKWGADKHFDFNTESVAIDIWGSVPYVEFGKGYARTGTESHFMVYVDVDGPTALFFGISNSSYTFYLKKNATYEVFEIGDAAWTTKDSVRVGADTGTNVKGYGIEFTEAFKGFVKVAYADIISDNGKELATYPWSNGMRICILSMGDNTSETEKQYADNIKIGPFFTVTEDSDSTEIEVPAEYQPGSIEATPIIPTGINGATISNAKKLGTIKPTSVANTEGYKLQVNTAYNLFDGKADADQSKLQYHLPNNSLDLSTSTHFMFYVKTDGPTTLTPEFIHIITSTGSWRNCYITKDAEIKLLKTGAEKWTEVSASQLGGESYGLYGVEFTEAFEGFVKIPLTDLAETNGATSISGKTASYMYTIVEAMGDGYAENIIVGPFFAVTSNSGSTKINVPEAYQSTAVEATPFNNYTVNGSGGGWATRSNVLPSSIANANGYKFVLKDGSAYDISANSDTIGDWSYLQHMYTAEGTTLGADTTHLLMYFETNGPIDITFRFQWTNRFSATTTYQYAKIGDTEWTSAQAKLVTANEYGMSFDSAFKGYIKIDYNCFNFSGTASIENLYVTPAAMGQVGEGKAYATSFVIGPFMGVTKDSSSTEIKVPNEWKYSAIEAEPIKVNGIGGSMLTNANKTTVRPTALVDVDGYKLTTKTVYDYSNQSVYDEASRGLFNTPSDPYESVADATHLMFYVKTDGPTALSYDAYNSAWTHYYIAADAEIKLLKNGDTDWKAQAADSVGTSHYGIRFTESFEGYVKISLDDIRNVDSGAKMTGNNIMHMYVMVEAMGGSNANNITVGPFLKVTKDSWSTEIKVPDKYKPTPMKVNPITNWTRDGQSYAISTTANVTGLLDWTSAEAIKMTRGNDGYSADYERTGGMNGSEAYTMMRMNNPLDLTGIDALMFYADIPAGNIIYPNIDMTIGYDMGMALKPGTAYYYKGVDDTEWTEGTVEYCGPGGEKDSRTIHGGIVMDKAFKGYIKFATTSLTCTDTTYSGSGVVNIIRIRVKGIGGAYGEELTFGPWFAVTSDSPSAEIKQNTVLGDTNLDAVLDETDLTDLRAYLFGNANKYVAKAGNVKDDGIEAIDILDLVTVNGYLNDFAFDTYTKLVTDGELTSDVYTFETELYLPETAYGNGGVLFTNSDTSDGNCISFEIAANGNPYFYLKNDEGVTELTFTECDVRTGDFAKLSFVLDETESSVSLYMNGELQATKSYTGSATQSVKTFAIGGDLSNENTSYFKGKIRNVSLYDSAAAPDSAATPFASYDLTKTVLGADLEASVGAVDLLGYAYLFDKNTMESSNYAYSFAVVGDPQTLLSKHPEKVAGIYEYIADNAAERNTQHTFILGDITDNNSPKQWATSVAAIDKLGDMSYTFVRGNHDGYAELNKYLATDEYLASGIVCKDGTDVDNYYMLKEINTDKGTHKYMFLNLDFGAYDDVLTWANEEIAQYPNHNVIITTHSYLNAKGSVLKRGEYPDATTYTYSVGDVDTKNDSEWASNVKSAQEMFDELISKHSNILMVLCGHVGTDKVVVSTNNGESGNKITQILIDAQDADGMVDGGLGMVATFYVSADGNSIEVEYYSTVHGKYLLRENQKVITLN